MQWSNVLRYQRAKIKQRTDNTERGEIQTQNTTQNGKTKNRLYNE